MSCKIDSVTRKHDLDVPQAAYDGVDDYLLQRWTGADGRSADGYRSLTEWFNKRLLKRVYDDHNREATGVRLDSEYEALRSDDDLTRQELADDLRAAGIDADELESSMVSWSTMRHHLNDCLEGSKETAEASSDWELESVRIAAERTEEKADEAVRSLASKEAIADGDAAEITVDVRLECPVCHVRTPLSEAAERGYVCREHGEDAGPEQQGEAGD